MVEFSKKKWTHWGKEIAKTLLFVFIISVAVDYWRRPNVPFQAADVSFTTLQRAAPNTLMAASANQTLVLYFWGSWCGMCKHTSPVMHDLHQNGVSVLGVALRSGSLQEVGDYLAQQQLAFDTINDEHGELSQAWGIQVTPTIVLIRNGKVIHSTTGLATYWGLKTRIALANVFS